MVARLPEGENSFVNFLSFHPIKWNFKRFKHCIFMFSIHSAQPEYYKDAPHFRSVVGSENKYWLEIPDAKLSYTGTYSVVASNCHGQTKAIISLQIFAKGEQLLSFDLV